MGFIMDGLDAEAYDREYKDSQLLARILGYFKPHLSVMAIIAVMIVLNSVMDAAFPFLIARGLDRLDGAADLNVTIWQRTAWLIGAIFVSGALSWTFNFFRQTYTARQSAMWCSTCARMLSMLSWPATCPSMMNILPARSSAG